MTDISNWREIGGERLRKARKAKDMTLAELSERIPRFSEGRLSMYERGNRAMAPDVATALGKILGVGAAYLLAVDDTVPGNEFLSDDPGIAELAARFHAAPAHIQQIVRDILAKTY